MVLTRSALLLVAVSAVAHAQPAPATPTFVAPTLPGAAPWIAEHGNLRLSLRCAERWLDPSNGLSVTVDGTPVDPLPLHANRGTIGYLVAPGHHHVAISTDDCAGSEFDFDASPYLSTRAFGRLAVASSWLQGPVGAPNGSGLQLGVWMHSMPMIPAPNAPTGTAPLGQSAAFANSRETTGGLLSYSWERRYVVTALDWMLSGGSVGGTISGDTIEGQESASFSGNLVETAFQWRVGAKLPLRYAAIEAGTGLAFDHWSTSTATPNDIAPFLSTPSAGSTEFYLPMWASVTVKPFCNWGVQVLGQYDLHPTSIGTGGVGLGVGFLYQPSRSCSHPAGVQVVNEPDPQAAAGVQVFMN